MCVNMHCLRVLRTQVTQGATTEMKGAMAAHHASRGSTCVVPGLSLSLCFRNKDAYQETRWREQGVESEKWKSLIATNGSCIYKVQRVIEPETPRDSCLWDIGGPDPGVKITTNPNRQPILWLSNISFRVKQRPKRPPPDWGPHVPASLSPRHQSQLKTNQPPHQPQSHTPA